MKAIFTKVNPGGEIKIWRTKFKKKTSHKVLKEENQNGFNSCSTTKESVALLGAWKAEKKTIPNSPETSPKSSLVHVHIAHIVQNLFPKGFAFF